MNEPSANQRTEIEQAIITRAQQDPAFREALRRNPHAALADHFGMPLPPGVNITVLEETPTQRYLVLPPAPAPELTALQASDLDLALAGGGRTFRPGRPVCHGREACYVLAARSSSEGRVLRRRAC